MKKSKSLIGLIVSTGLMVNIFLAIPIQAQIAKTTERERLKAEIKEKFKIRAEIKGKIKTIEKTVNRLKNAKIFIPIIIGTAGISATVIAAAIAAAPFFLLMLMSGKTKKILEELSKLKKRLKVVESQGLGALKEKELDEMKAILGHSKRLLVFFTTVSELKKNLVERTELITVMLRRKNANVDQLNKTKTALERVIKFLKPPEFFLDKTFEQIKNTKNMLPELKKNVIQIYQDPTFKNITRNYFNNFINRLDNLLEHGLNPYQTAEVLQYIKESLWWLPQEVFTDLKNARGIREFVSLDTWLDSAKTTINKYLSKFTIHLLISIVPPFVVLFSGIIGTSVLSIGTLLGLSAASMKQTIKLAEELRLLEKKYPGMLTRKERQILAQLKKFSKNPITRSIIENLRLKGALQKIVITAMQQHPSLVARMGKKADKTLSKYIQRRWESKKLQRTLDQITKKGFTSAITTIRLKNLKRKLNKIEKRYPDLKPTLTKAVETFGTTADSIVEELKKQILEQADLKALELLEKPELPVVPL